MAVASNFSTTFRALTSHFEQETGHTLTSSFASTGKLYAQIENRAPFDVFLAADSTFPLRLEQSGSGVIGTRQTYAIGKLVLWSSKPRFSDGKHYLHQQGFSRLAIGNPKTVPYGQAAQSFLQQAGLWHQLQGKLIRGHNIAQAFQFVATDNVEVGLLALSQVLDWRHQREASTTTNDDSFWLIPPSLYPPIEQQAILLENGKENPAARDFLRFLYSPNARQIIKKHGYEVAP